MPEPLTSSQIDSKTDPTVATQWDSTTPKKEQLQDFYKTVDGLRTGLLTTIREGVGPVSRSMAVAKREGNVPFLSSKSSIPFSKALRPSWSSPAAIVPPYSIPFQSTTYLPSPTNNNILGPDFLFLSNNHSSKFTDLARDPTAQVTFQNSSSQDWVSISGTATTTSNSDPRIKQLYSKGMSAWFGDLGDGIPSLSPNSHFPPPKLIENG